MGEVYEADDTTLKVHVALKVIHPRIALDKAANARFLREIQLARKVTHPNVCRIFDVGFYRRGSESGAFPDARELPFLTMELLPGETLEQHLRIDGPMRPEQALPLMEQIAAGLDAAHAAEVVHRDFKCGNVMLVDTGSGTKAVITDFGLAQSETPSDPMTDTVSVVEDLVGTPPYMSPEQVKGQPASTASDIYAFGVAIFNMVTCKYPFTGISAREAVLKRLNEAPTSPRTYAPSLDARWEEVILRCLARNPEDRFQSAMGAVRALCSGDLKESKDRMQLEKRKANSFGRHPVALVSVAAFALLAGMIAAVPALREKLRDATGWVGVPEEKQLAILPFTALTQDSDTGAFARGLSETLTARMARLTENHSLQVIPSTEIRNNHIETIQQARREYGINLGLEGTVERAGSMVRITYHLIDAVKQRQLRAETITAPASDPFALEDEVASSVIHGLEIELRPQERSVVEANRTTQPAAYDFWLQGRGYLQDYFKPGNLDSAISEFSQALALDSKYAPAYAGLGEAYWYKYEDDENQDWISKATAACEQSLQHNDRSAEGHNCLGVVNQGTGKYELAARQFQEALELEPTSDDAVRELASAYAHLNKTVEAEETYKKAIALRPHYWRGYNMIGAFYYAHARYDDAAKMFRQVVALAPDNYRGYSNLGAIDIVEGKYGDAVPLFERAIAIQPSADAYSNLATTYFHLKRFAESASTFEKAVKLDDRSYIMWGNFASALDKTPERHGEATAAYKKAIALAEQQLQVNPRDPGVLGNLAEYHSMLGEKQPAIKYIGQALSQAGDQPSVMFKAAEVYEQLGDKKAAVHWLTAALKAGYSPTIVRDSPVMDELRSDPRVENYLKQK